LAIVVRRTPLFDGHTASGAKLVDYAGWEMPIQYSGVLDEYQAVRTKAGLFDVSHMGRITIGGDASRSFLQHLTTTNVAKLGLLESHYSMLCNQHGGIKDDIFVYRLKPQEFLICVNASNREKILAWLREKVSGLTGIEIRDRSTDIAQLALQGPSSRTILESLSGHSLALLKHRYCLEAKLLGVQSLVTRTGYTGELGYELYVPAESALWIWQELLTRGKTAGLKPAGLGARDLLRLEMAYLLYGNDITEDTTPFEASADWVVEFQKGEFIGRDALKQQQEEGPSRRLVSFELLEKAVPRRGFKVLSETRSGGRKNIGEVTSGNLSPILQKGVGLCYLPPSFTTSGSSIAIDIRGRIVPAVVVKPPFYKKPRVIA
jgi:aminomethyltransferase